MRLWHLLIQDVEGCGYGGDPPGMRLLHLLVEGVDRWGYGGDPPGMRCCSRYEGSKPQLVVFIEVLHHRLE